MKIFLDHEASITASQQAKAGYTGQNCHSAASPPAFTTAGLLNYILKLVVSQDEVIPIVTFGFIPKQI